MSKSKKSTKGIMQGRVNTIIPLVSFLTRHEIQGYIKKNQDWNISDNQLDVYIAKAKEALKKNWDSARSEAIERSYNNSNNLFKKAFQDGDWKTCLSIQDKIDKLAGIHDKQIIESTNTNINLEKEITDEMTAQEASQIYHDTIKRG